MKEAPRQLPPALLYAVFFLSGFAAILYQIVWQRSLFTIYGTNAESVTIVVTAFMLGLGLGTLAGGWVSRYAEAPLLVIFAVLETAIGIYGLLSLALFRRLASFTAAATGLEVGAAALGAVLVPTLLMGATLPLLVAYRVRRSGNVGQSVGTLYFVNTLGSAGGSFAAALFILGWAGQALSVQLAAAVNILAAVTILGGHLWTGAKR